jgi:hypothetical protein
MATTAEVRQPVGSNIPARLDLLRRSPFTRACKTVRRLGAKHGGIFADGIHFRYQCGQIRSLLSLLSYLGSGEYRERFLGVKIPYANIQDHHLQEACKFADGLANRLAGNTPVK